jgi:DNA polymerase-3 subunit alpha
MASLLSSVMDTKDRVPFYVAACAEMDLAVLPPDVNLSGPDFAVTGPGEIRFGLTAVKGVGEKRGRRDPRGARRGRPLRVDLGLLPPRRPGPGEQAALESLIRGGALDSTGASRLGMLEALPAAMGQAPAAASTWRPGRSRSSAPSAAASRPSLSSTRRSRRARCRATSCWPPRRRPSALRVEPPLNDCRRQLARVVTCGLAELVDRADGEAVTVGGLIGVVKNIMTRRGEPMMFARLDDSRARWRS